MISGVSKENSSTLEFFKNSGKVCFCPSEDKKVKIVRSFCAIFSDILGRIKEETGSSGNHLNSLFKFLYIIQTNDQHHLPSSL